MGIKIINLNNTYKNRHASVHRKKNGRPKIGYSTTMANSSRYISPQEVLQDLIPIKRVNK